MENEKTPFYVAFSTQKGGVGKTTFTVLRFTCRDAASLEVELKR